MMRARTVVTGVLLLFVAISVVYLVLGKNHAREGGAQSPTDVSKREVESKEADGAPTPSEEESAPEVIAYYFHGNRRCTTCRTIEAYAEEAIRTNFPAELASRKLQWRVVNVDQPENAHFIQDYQLVTRSLVLVGMEKDVQKKWKNLDKVWQLVRSKPEFTDYVVESTREFMAGKDG
jgi:hypothetical protein